MKTFEKLYEQKDYPAALEALKKGAGEISSDAWNYNMGTVYAKLGNWPMARLHLIQSVKQGFSSEKLIQNLELVEEKLEIGKLEKPTSTADYVIQGSQFINGGVLTALSLIIFIIGLWKLKNKMNYNRVIFWSILMLLPLLINLWISHWPFGIVQKHTALRDGPSVIFPTKDELPAGVLVLSIKKNGWTKIIYPSRFEGWVKEEIKNLE